MRRVLNESCTQSAGNMELVALTEAACLFPKRNGNPLCYRTIYRRATKGWRGVKLQTLRDGHHLFTSREWVEEFQAACSRTDRITEPTRIERQLASHKAAFAEANRRLGINGPNCEGAAKSRKGKVSRV